MPGRSGLSSLDPTWYQTWTLTIGVAWSSLRIATSPFGSVNRV